MSRSGIRTIDSLQNSSLKTWRRYLQHPEDSDCPWIPLEGPKQVRELARRLPPALVIVSSDQADRHREALEISEEAVQVPPRIMERLSDVRTAQGILGFFPKPSCDWEDLPARLLYLDGIQDPGNLGTIFRTAAAAGDWGLVTAPGTVSCFNSKVVRASAGYLFRVPFLERCALEEVVERGVVLWIADSAGGVSLFSAPLEQPCCVVIGSEGGGTRQREIGTAQRLHIPMADGVESLNAAVSAALVLYEARRRVLQTPEAPPARTR